MEFASLVATVLIISLFVIVIMTILVQRNLRDRVNLIENNENSSPPSVSPIQDQVGPMSPEMVTISREDCFSFEPDPEIFVGTANNLNDNLLWRQMKINQGGMVEEVDLSLIPTKVDSNPVVITTDNYQSSITHVQDVVLVPGQNSVNTLRVESPLSTGGLTLPFKGLETDNGSNSNADSFEFVFDAPVGIVGFDALDLIASTTEPAVIRLWDEEGFLFWQGGISQDYDASVVFVGISDPLNRIKVMRIAVGNVSGSNSNEWSICNISIGENSPYGQCDVSRIINAGDDRIDVLYRNNGDQSVISDPEIIADLLMDP